MVYLRYILGFIWYSLSLYTRQQSYCWRRWIRRIRPTYAARQIATMKYSACVSLLAVKLSNTLNVAVNHRSVSWGATFRCCQMILCAYYLLIMCLFHFHMAIRPLWPQSWLLNLSKDVMIFGCIETQYIIVIYTIIMICSVAKYLLEKEQGGFRQQSMLASAR